MLFGNGVVAGEFKKIDEQWDIYGDNIMDKIHKLCADDPSWEFVMDSWLKYFSDYNRKVKEAIYYHLLG